MVCPEEHTHLGMIRVSQHLHISNTNITTILRNPLQHILQNKPILSEWNKEENMSDEFSVWTELQTVTVTVTVWGAGIA
jgi:hypothetical protein